MLDILENHKPRVYFSNPGFAHEPFIFKGFGWLRYIYISNNIQNRIQSGYSRLINQPLVCAVLT